MQLKNLKKLGDQIGKDISRGMDSATKELNKAIHGSVVIVSAGPLDPVAEVMKFSSVTVRSLEVQSC